MQSSQNIPSHEGSQPQDDAQAPPDYNTSLEESLLTSIAGPSSGTQQYPETQSPEDSDAPSEWETIHYEPDDSGEWEQLYTTAPSSFGPSADPAVLIATPYVTMRNKGKGRDRGNEHCERTNTSPWRRRSNSPQAAQADALDQLGLAIMTCSESVHANTQEMEQIWCSHAQELEQLQLKTTCMLEDMQNIQCLYKSIRIQNRGQDDRSDSIHAMASRALYTEHRSSEGTASYERQQSARAQFEATQNLGGPRIVEEDCRASPNSGTENRSE
jgi:hypothetical protein